MLLLRLYSALNGLFFAIRRRRRWFDRRYQESPSSAHFADCLSPRQRQRVFFLQKQYQIRFEDVLSQSTSLENYHVLDLLDQFMVHANLQNKQSQVLVDIGSQNFFYARALCAFFKPQKISGIELDGYPVYHDWHSRASYAKFYTSGLPAEYVVADFAMTSMPCDGITWFYPFVTAYPLLAYQLPLSEFKPQVLFNHAHSQLNPNGWMIMANHGEDEWQVAKDIATGAGFFLHTHLTIEESLVSRTEPPVLSYWTLKDLQ